MKPSGSRARRATPTWPGLGLVVSLAILASGCGSDSTSPNGNASSPKPSPSAIDPAAPNVGERALKIGETREGISFETTLLKVRYPYPPGEYREPETGKAFVGMRVRVCMKEEAESTGEDYSTYNGEWFAASSNGDQATSSSSWDDWPAPKFPENVTMNPGECLRGWLSIEIPKKMKVAKIVYRPGGETVAEWIL